MKEGLLLIALCTIDVNSKGWLYVTRTLIRADYIGFSLIEVR